MDIAANRAVRFLALMLVLATSACVLVRDALYPPVTWEFIQSVGGLELGQPYLDKRSNVIALFRLPLKVDLSGARPVTHTPIQRNTGLVCQQARLIYDEPRIEPGPLHPPVVYKLELQVFATDDPAAAQPSCNEVPLPLPPVSIVALSPGAAQLRVWYRDSLFSKHLISELTL